MKKVSGTVRFRDLETGVWVLETDDGRTFQLGGGDRKLMRDGARVKVEGDVDETGMTSAMVGPRITVHRYSFAD